MATKTTTTLTDDIDGSSADVTVSYSWNGQAYEIDLNSRNSDEFADALAPYLAASRKAGGSSGDGQRRGRRTASSQPAATSAGSDVDPKAVRAWARDNGVAVSPRGRLSSTVVEQYRTAH